MKIKSIEEISEKYDIELEKIISDIKKSKAKLVLLQFPDGLKPYATSVVDFLREKTNAEFLIWEGTCYGACDTPTGLGKLKPKIDLIIQFGHSELMPSY
ncbi:MAG: diphthamide synthesis protein [Candidatus Pacearchaeota archaeon]|nr:diphthamide synthesis protein [Candidatus Pacearchaeota archaeon]